MGKGKQKGGVMGWGSATWVTCDECGKKVDTSDLSSGYVIPEGWHTMQFDSLVVGIYCSSECAIKAATDKIPEVWNRK